MTSQAQRRQGRMREALGASAGHSSGSKVKVFISRSKGTFLGPPYDIFEHVTIGYP